MISDTDLAYAAGLFDGEGSVLLLPGPPFARYRVRMKVELSQVESAPLLWLRQRFGGPVYLRTEQASPRCRLAHRWHLCGSNAVAFLRLIRPYLIVKAHQADVAFSFYETVQAKGGTRIAIDQSIVSRREELRQQMKLLNKRGVA